MKLCSYKKNFFFLMFSKKVLVFHIFLFLYIRVGELKIRNWRGIAQIENILMFAVTSLDHVLDS